VRNRRAEHSRPSDIPQKYRGATYGTWQKVTEKPERKAVYDYISSTTGTLYETKDVTLVINWCFDC